MLYLIERFSNVYKDHDLINNINTFVNGTMNIYLLILKLTEWNIKVKNAFFRRHPCIKQGFHFI